MLALLVVSAFFSGSETAFFNLSNRQIRLLCSSRHRVQRLVAAILDQPGHLLNSLLFGNMAVNVLYFSTASVLSMTIKKDAGLTAAALAALLSFVLLVLMGEIVPKSLAYANSPVLCTIVAVPAYLWMKVFRPFEFIFKVFILEPVLRIVLGPARAPKELTVAEFRSLIEATRRQGLISAHENRLLTEVIELGFLKVRHVMRPRVDMVVCSLTSSPQAAIELMRTHGLTKIPVYSRKRDNIVGVVYLRDLLLKPSAKISDLVKPVHFVPEQKTVESLLEFFRQSGTDMAVVVDEYGGIAGSVRLEDIAQELFGQIEGQQRTEPIKQLGPFEYRLSGSLPIHDWAEAFGIDISHAKICTMGGLVTALLGRIPRSGDVARLKNLKFTVENVTKGRIESVRLTLGASAKDG